MKPDWFGPETWPLLRGYCLHVCMADQLAQRLRITPVDAPEYRQLSAQHRSELKTMMSVATKLRITPRANRYAGDGRDSGRFHPRPWEPA
jgi:hypothetical protein